MTEVVNQSNFVNTHTPGCQLLFHLNRVTVFRYLVTLGRKGDRRADRTAAAKQQGAREKKRVRKENIPNIRLGDAVLVAEAVPSNKLQMTWTGPHQVVNAVSPYVYEVEPMLPVRGRRRRKLVHIV